MTDSAKAIRVRFVVGSIVVLVSSLLLVFSGTAQSKTTPKRRGTPAAKPTAPVRAVNAEEMQGLLKRDGDRPLLVNFWATWCVPCREEFPELVKIDKDYGDKGLDFIAITLDDLVDIRSAVPRFLRLMKAKMPVYLLNVADPDPVINRVDAEWGGVLPATFLYNNKGQVVYKHFGRVKTDELRAAIDKVLSSE